MVLGIDIGGSGVKGAYVDLRKGEFASERVRVPTPARHTPALVMEAVKEVVASLEADYGKCNGIIGVGFPGVVKSQIIETAANLGGKAFTGVNLAEIIGRECGLEAWVLNDADAAGLAEVRYGLDDACHGTVLVLTVGTGIGSALFENGKLVPNLELGHLVMKDKSSGRNMIAEKICSDAARKKLDLSWKRWACRFSRYLEYVHSLVRPDLVVLGGGIASKSEKFLEYLKAPCEIEIAKLQNRAGIIGAALSAREHLK